MLNLKSIKFTIFFVVLFVLSSCEGDALLSNTFVDTSSDINSSVDLRVPHITLNPSDSDSDMDYIPDSLERLQGRDPFNPDENNNSIKDGLEGDPFFPYQWYIYSRSDDIICNTAHIETIKGNDLDIMPLYHYTLGNNNGTQTIQVVDGGIDKHPDIDLDINNSINSINNTLDPTPTEGFSTNPTQIFYRGHGTAVAGIIGARGFNNIGIRGIAPTVKIAGSNWLESEDISKLDEVWCADNNITISNNSWGTKFIDDFSYETIMEKASNELRDGRGRIFVFAGGNEREEFSNANLSYLLNNPYSITVSAINHKNQYASYSTAGSNILVSAYGGEHYYSAPTIFTTFTPNHTMSESELMDSKGPITIDEDTNRSYTYAMNGSSAAAPMVSGALALVLDMCPSLSWRDIRWLIALSSTKIDENNSEWITNSFSLSHNNNYGFGRINPLGMVEICLSPDYKNLPKQIKSEITIDYESIIPDNNQSVEKLFIIDRDMQIDWVGLTVTLDHKFAGDIEIELVSPSGTISHIIDKNFINFNAYKDGFRFSTVSLMGERSKGVWRVKIRDALLDDRGVLKRLKLEIRGYDL